MGFHLRKFRKLKINVIKCGKVAAIPSIVGKLWEATAWMVQVSLKENLQG